ncbi:serine hydrolase [Iamia majanohamensis]|uniref:Serine hydrolase n=1 Tax=Iamia majanohamensis TaxID=467976 RepID=A0AAF0BT18_9ACTN|nr:serine hydrolase [Iamia majanohamensis]WCO69261.1 serine hydrolase [Iamia majanohamensis]
MRRSLPLLGLALLLGALLGALPAGAQEPPPPPDSPIVTTGPVDPPASSIVVDADTGEVVSARNERAPMLPASTTKILTSLLVRQQLELDEEIAISQTATLAEPHRLGLQAGSLWRVEDLLYAAMLCSCNDAAWALGQAAGGGSMSGFGDRAAALVDTLGMEDDPVVRDPAGFDDFRSVSGGNRLSARDLAIAARAYLADPELAAISRTPRHEWVGGDGEPHFVNNLNLFLDAYEGAIGLKTGATDAAGSIFVGAAERDGRTLIAVVMQSPARYAEAAALLDAGFVLSSVGDVTDDVLPPVPAGLTGGGTPTTTAPSTTAAPTTAPATSTTGAADAPTPSSAAVPADDEQAAGAAPAVGSPSSGTDWPATPMWVGGGAAVVLAGGGVAALARRRAAAGGIDRRPARPRRRHRRRARRRAAS